MRILAIACATSSLLLVITANAQAADDARAVSRSTLRAMGFGSAQVLRDHEGDLVRGKGHFAIVRGSASAGGTTKTYLNVAPPGNTASGFKNVFSGGLIAGGGAKASAY